MVGAGDTDTAVAAATTIRLCGQLSLEVGGHDLTRALPGGQADALLGYLLANRQRAADRDELIAVLWPERPPRDPQAGLRPVLSRLRRALEPVTLEGKERLRVALPEPVWVDVEEAARAVEAARAAAKDGAWKTVREQAQAAVDLLRPGFLRGHEGAWVDAHRREVEETELEALEWLARSALALGGSELSAAERAGRELIARAPFRETGHRFLMEALAASGNVAEALRVYEELRVLLRDELGTAPAADVQALHTRLLQGDSPTATATATTQPAPKPPERIPLPTLLSPRERSAFVGREHELGVLQTAWDRARSGSRRLVVVAGEPGIGKTRLTSEFARAAHDDGTVLYAGCQEEALVSYQPFVEALRHFARSSGVDWSQVALGPGAAELARLIPELAAAQQADDGDATGDAETRRYLMFEGVSSMLTEASARTPLLLVLDDLHWADRGTLHLLRHVIRAPHEASLLIVGTYRAAEVGDEHPLAELLADLRRDGLFDRISLAGLDEGGVGTLIESHAGHEAPSGLVGAVHEQTEGNPFFIEEVMRHLIETGALVERDGRWVSALTPGEIGVPEGVKEVLVRRLARLSDDCRAALSEASALGREFSFDVLRAMTQADDDALIAVLEEALAAQLIVEVDRGAGPAYAYTHALVREVLYAAMSGPRRQRLHARAAAAIEQAIGEPPVAALALHHRMAGSAGDPEKAVDYSLRAGADAAALFAWEEAVTHWDGAVAVMARAGGREAERARLLLTISDLTLALGDLAGHIEQLEHALALYEQLGDDERAAQAHSRLGMAHALIDSIYAEHLDVNKAVGHFAAARKVLDQGPPRRARGHLEVGVATAMTYGVQTEQGIEAGVRAMEIAEQIGDEMLWASASESCGWQRIAAGQLEEGLSMQERAFEVADRARRPFLAFMGANIRGQMSWGLGAPDEAQAWFERPLKLPYFSETSYWNEIADGIGRAHASRGEIAEARRLRSDAKPAWFTHSLKPLLDLWEGNWADLESLATRVLDTSRRSGNRWDEWSAHHLGARVRYLRGDLDGAADRLEQALAIVVDGGARYFEMWVRPDLARVCAERGHLEEARADIARCREIVDGGEDWRGRAGHVALADAVVLAHAGENDEADARFAEAYATLDRYRLRVDQADALHQWGRALARAGDRAAATEKLDGAAELYRRYEAGAAWVARVDADRV